MLTVDLIIKHSAVSLLLCAPAAWQEQCAKVSFFYFRIFIIQSCSFHPIFYVGKRFFSIGKSNKAHFKKHELIIRML